MDNASTNRLIRKGVDSPEIDILGISHDKRKTFVVEVKASLDRVEHIKRFAENMAKLREFLPFLEDYEIIPIYAGLNTKQETIKELTKRRIYALIMNGDVFEIHNFEKIKK